MCIYAIVILLIAYSFYEAIHVIDAVMLCIVELILLLSQLKKYLL